VIRKALGDAVRKGRLTRNVAASTTLPKMIETEVHCWTLDEVRRFLDSVRDDRLYALYHLALVSGLRRGELCGLPKKDVDLEKSSVHIRQTLLSIGYEMHFETPKSGRSNRRIDLDPATVAVLKEHFKRQAEERLAAGPAWVDSGLVFTREDGSPLHPETVSDHFERRVRRAGLPRIRFHDLRHTYATLALEAGMKPWDLSDRLGHSSVAFTLAVYRHAIPSTQREATERAAVFILGTPSG
jgi:integrase